MSKKKTLYEWLTTDFTVNFQNEHDFSLKRSFRLNYSKILLGMFLFVVMLSATNFWIFTKVNEYFSDEGRREKVYKEKLIHINMMVDTLHREIAKRDSFINSMKNIVSE